MCIICNTNMNVSNAANDYLIDYDRAVKHMKQAEAAMLECSKHAVTFEIAQRYKKVHKAMIKARKAWTALQQIREQPNV